MCDNAVDDCLAALNLFPICFLQVKWLKNILLLCLQTKIYSIFTENSDNVVFKWNRMGILNIDLDNIDLGDTNYEEDDLDTIILIRLLTCHIKFEKGKELKKIKINKKNKWRINVSCVAS